MQRPAKVETRGELKKWGPYVQMNITNFKRNLHEKTKFRDMETCMTGYPDLMGRG